MCAWRANTPPDKNMPLLVIILVCAAILFGLECLCGIPGLTRWGMVTVLVLLGSIIGIANWCILINNLRGRKYASFIPLLATLCFAGAARLLGAEEHALIIPLAQVIDPWPWTIVLGLPWLLLRKIIRGSRSTPDNKD